MTANAALAPDGTMTADFVDYSTAITNSQDLLQTVAVNPAGRTLTFSVWVKGTSGETISLRLDQNGLSGTYQTYTLDGNWQHLSVTRTYPADGPTSDVLARFGTRPLGTAQGTAMQVYAWGAQLEFGSSMTDYQAVGAVPTVPVENDTVTGVVAGTQGSAVGNVGTSVTGVYGTVNIGSTGVYTYSVDNANAAVQALRTSGQTLIDVFTYTIQDVAGASSTTQLTVTIQGSNDAPTAVADTATAVEAGGIANGTSGTNPTGNVLTNDTDPDSAGNGETKTVNGVAAGTVGSASGSVGTSVTGTYGSINIGSNGAYTYTVDNNSATVQALRNSSNTLSDVFTYTMVDAAGVASSTQITVTIQGANDNPVAVSDNATAVEAGGH